MMALDSTRRPAAAAKAALLALEAAAAAWIAAAWLPEHASRINGGAVFAGYILALGFLLAAAGVLIRGSLRGVGWEALLLAPASLWLYYRGTVVASEALVNFGAIPYFAAASILLAVMAARPTGPEAGAPTREWLWSIGLALAGLGLGSFIWHVRNWAVAVLRWPEDKTSLGMLLMARDNITSTDIGGRPFQQHAWLPLLAAFAAALVALFLLRARLGRKAVLLALFGLAVFGKLATEALSTDGLAIVGHKIESVNTNYFRLSVVADELGPAGLVRDYNQRQATIGFHGDTHPPLPIVLYWMLKKLCFGSPTGVGLCIMLLSALAVLPFYRVGWMLGGEDAGFAAAALFVSSPLSLILGNAGADSLVFALVAYSLWGVAEGAVRGGWRWPLFGGICLGFASYFSFGASSALVFLGVWGSILAWRRGAGLDVFAARFLMLWGAFVAGLAAVHFGLWAYSSFHFSYLQSVKTAQFVHLQANHYRPFELWSWANVVLYSGYVGAGLLALYLGSVGRSLLAGDTRDAGVWMSLAFILTVMLMAYGRAEVQRQFLFGGVFLIPAAALFLPKGADGRRSAWGLGTALVLNVLTAAYLQIHVLDYW